MNGRDQDLAHAMEVLAVAAASISEQISAAAAVKPQSYAAFSDQLTQAGREIICLAEAIGILAAQAAL